MDVLSPNFKLFSISHAAIRETALPYRKLRSESMRKSALHESDCAFERNVERGQKQMNVIRHNDECVKFEVS